MGDDSQAEVVEFLADPDTYGVEGPVERINTHISVVFLAGDRAYKLKRAVRFPYLDFSDPQDRCRFCHDEVTINRRTAPELYEGVEAVVRRADGTLALGGDGDPVDWLVVMKRFDQATLWETKARSGALTPADVNELADTVATFHQDAEVRRAGNGGEAIERIIRGNENELRRFVPAVFEPADVEHLTRACDHAWTKVRELLDHRALTGSVRRCHGDLHLRNICEIDGHPRPFDAIEFSADIAVIDVLYDVAFLIMDLEHHGLRPLANLVMNRYLSLTRDYEGLAAMPLFIALRAGVRAHVMASSMARAEDPGAAAEDARQFMDLALAAFKRPDPRMIAIGGLSGSGKSTLARRVAASVPPVPGAVHLQSDVVRKRLAGVAPETRLDEAHYAEDISQRVYGQMRHDAGRAVSAGYTVIVDATFLDAAQRHALEETAAESRVPFFGLWLHASMEEMERRLTSRRNDASDARVEVLHRQLRSDPTDIDWSPLCAGPSEEATFLNAMRIMNFERTVAAERRRGRNPAETKNESPRLEMENGPEARPTGTCPK